MHFHARYVIVTFKNRCSYFVLLLAFKTIVFFLLFFFVMNFETWRYSGRVVRWTRGTVDTWY